MTKLLTEGSRKFSKNLDRQLLCEDACSWRAKKTSAILCYDNEIERRSFVNVCKQTLFANNGNTRANQVDKIRTSLRPYMRFIGSCSRKMEIALAVNNCVVLILTTYQINFVQKILLEYSSAFSVDDLTSMCNILGLDYAGIAVRLL